MKIKLTYKIYNNGYTVFTEEKHIIVNKREFNRLIKRLKEANGEYIYIFKASLNGEDELIHTVEKINRAEKTPPRGWRAVGGAICYDSEKNRIITFFGSNRYTYLEVV